MAKKLRVKDRLLIGILFIEEFLDATVGAGSRAYHAGKMGFWTPPNYKASSFNQNVNRMLKTGDLEKEIVNGEPMLKISGQGKNKLSRRFSYFKMQKKSWDRNWRLVIFDISEKNRKKRNALRWKLKSLGFGMWQRSIYISPFDVEEDMYEFLQTKDLLGEVHILTTKHKLLGDAKEMASKVWHLDKINNRYIKLFNKTDEWTKIKLVKLSNIRQVCYDYTVLLLDDPCLPKELLPGNWMGEKVKQRLSELLTIAK